jgi:diacylglycerol kinase family enzyme
VTAPTHLLVANPAAQSGRNAGRIDRALRALAAVGIRTRLLPTLPDGGTVAAVREALDRDGHRCVIAMGGDGTFREVAQGLFESARREEVALAMLPSGTANNHGRSFGIEAKGSALERNVRVITAGRETRLDVGNLHMMSGTGETVARATFVDSVGWGIGARVIARRNLDRRWLEGKGRLGAIYRDQLVYAGAVLRTVVASRGDDAFGASVIADGEPREFDRLTELLVKGTRVYAGRWVIDRTSRHDDGLFEVAAFRDKRRWISTAVVDVLGGAVLDAGLRAVGRPPGLLLKPFRVSRLVIGFRVPEGSPPPAVQVDGEEFPTSERATIEVVPRAVRLIVP